MPASSPRHLVTAKALRPPSMLAAALVLLVTVALLAATGCGEDEPDAAREQRDALALLKRAFGPGHPVDSGRLELRLRVDARTPGMPARPLNVGLRGPFAAGTDARMPKFAVTLDLGDDAQFNGGLISTGAKAYVTINGQPFALADADVAKLRDAYLRARRESRSGRRDGPTLGALGVDPSRWLRRARRVGEERVGGVGTTHVTASIDAPAMLADVDRMLRRARSMPQASGRGLPPRIDAAQRAAITRSLKRATLDAWVGKDDGTLRRVRMRLRLEPADADRARIAGLERLDAGLSLTLADLGRPQRITAPADARPIGDLARALQELRGSGAGGGGSAPAPQDAPSPPATTTPPSTTAPPTATPTTPDGSAADELPPEQRDYARCIEQAGEDLAAVQRCAERLNP